MLAAPIIAHGTDERSSASCPIANGQRLGASFSAARGGL
jgi:hypothetical protein